MVGRDKLSGKYPKHFIYSLMIYVVSGYSCRSEPADERRLLSTQLTALGLMSFLKLTFIFDPWAVDGRYPQGRFGVPTGLVSLEIVTPTGIGLA